jgi:sirohydrochlorin ferrochelatase
MQALLFISHGSRVPEMYAEVAQLLERLERHGQFDRVQAAFLDCGEPDIPAAVRACVAAGADEIFVLLNFLNTGRHVAKDIPGLLKRAGQEFPGVHFYVSKHLGAYPEQDQVYLQMIQSLKNNSIKQNVIKVRKEPIMALAEGGKAPEFQAAASNGQKVALKDFRGKKRVVLYFYPKDDTPGCTVEACGFRDKNVALEKNDAVILKGKTMIFS